MFKPSRASCGGPGRAGSLVETTQRLLSPGHKREEVWKRAGPRDSYGNKSQKSEMTHRFIHAENNQWESRGPHKLKYVIETRNRNKTISPPNPHVEETKLLCANRRQHFLTKKLSKLPRFTPIKGKNGLIKNLNPLRRTENQIENKKALPQHSVMS